MIDQFGMDRRALLQRVLMLTGAAMLPGGAQALAAAAKGGKRTLSPARYAVLTALADTIVPKTDTAGALDAEVPARLDALVGIWATPEHKAEIVAAIDKVDVEARAKQGKGFDALTAEERTAFLTAYDAAALKAPRPRPHRHPPRLRRCPWARPRPRSIPITASPSRKPRCRSPVRWRRGSPIPATTGSRN
jgi:hypothetical protein